MAVVPRDALFGQLFYWPWPEILRIQFDFRRTGIGHHRRPTDKVSSTSESENYQDISRSSHPCLPSTERSFPVTTPEATKILALPFSRIWTRATPRTTGRSTVV